MYEKQAQGFTLTNVIYRNFILIFRQDKNDKNTDMECHAI